jgi:AmmeMemoRadiSam system protein A
MRDEPARGSERTSIPELTVDQKKQLLHLARQSIAEAITPGLGGRQDEQALPPALHALLEVFTGVFVSLHLNEGLRGCIGYLDAIQPLPEAIRETARAAALRDPRFEALREDELREVDIEISVLSPLEKISSPTDIATGRDGLMVRHGKLQGVLLPQVAERAGLDALSFLEHTCLKAGLPKDAWQLPETEVFRFGAEVFGEKSFSS